MVEQHSQDEKEVLLWSEELGVNIAVCPHLQLTSHTQPTSTLSRIKCERYIFIKKCVRSFIEVVIIVDYVSAYICICMWLYNSFTNKLLPLQNTISSLQSVSPFDDISVMPLLEGL